MTAFPITVISGNTVDKMTKEGIIPIVRVRRQIRINRAEMDNAFQARNTNRG